jgi:integrase
VRWRDEAGRSRSRTFDRKVDADRWAVEVEHRMASGTYVDPAAARTPFGEYLDRWLAMQVWRPTTRQTAESYLTRHVRPTFDNRPLGSIRTSEVQTWVKRLAETLSPRSVEQTYHYFRSAMRAAVADRMIPVSPCVGIKLPKPEPLPVNPLTVEQVETIADAVPERYRAAVVLAAATGLRQGEVFGLTIDRVDFLRRTLVVDQQLVTATGSVALGPLKTRASYRTIPLPDVALEVLASHLARWPVEHPWGLVFVDDRGAPVRRNRWSKLWKAAATSTGLPDVTSHALRHHFASLLIAAGCSVKVVQNRLGHATAAETLDTYAHLWPDDEDRTRAAVDRAWERDVARPKRVPSVD